MDPFSVTVGIVGVVDGGLSLAGMLKEKISAYRNAENEIMELAHEVDLATNLIDMVGINLDSQQNLPKNVVKQSKRLVSDVRSTIHFLTTNSMLRSMPPDAPDL